MNRKDAHSQMVHELERLQEEMSAEWIDTSLPADWSGLDFWDDVVNGVIKSVVFGFVCAWIAVYQGYDCVPTSAGISSATTKTVVYSSLAVLGLDFVLTALT